MFLQKKTWGVFKPPQFPLIPRLASRVRCIAALPKKKQHKNTQPVPRNNEIPGSSRYVGVEPKMGDFTPKMDGEHHGKAYEQMG